MSQMRLLLWPLATSRSTPQMSGGLILVVSAELHRTRGSMHRHRHPGLNGPLGSTGLSVRSYISFSKAMVGIVRGRGRNPQCSIPMEDQGVN